ncbi:MAG: rhodanese-like domain-containing protein, partial [Chloroflexota bacterium]
MRIKILKIIILTLLCLPMALPGLAVGCQAAAPVGKTGEAPIIEDVTVARAAALMENNKGNADFIIIDVRTPGEYEGGHIAGAVNLDFNAAGFNAEVDKLDKNKTYLVYCQSGRRSAG